MFTNSVARALVILVPCCMVVVACGSGGGDDSNSIPLPPAAFSPLKLDQANAELAAVAGLVMASVPLTLAGLAAESIRKVAARPDDQFTEECPFNGAADYVFTDSNQDGGLGPGDRIRVTYRECLVSLFQQTGSGSFVITLDQPAESSTGDDRFYSGTMDARSLTPEVTSLFDFDLHFGLLEETHRAFGNVSFRLVIDGTIYAETLLGLNAVKQANFETARNNVSFAGTLNSSLLEGSLQFDGSTSLSGFLNTYPEQGRIELIGATGSRVAVIPYNVANSTLATVAVDEAGGGTFVELVDRPFWTSLLPDFAWSYLPTHSQYVRPFDPGDFWFAGGSTVRGEAVPVNTTLRLQFSRELDASTVPSVISILRLSDEKPYFEEVDVATDTRGAAIILRPFQQLRHNSQYTYPIQTFAVGDLLGNSTYVCCGEVWTPANLSSIATAEPAFGVPGTLISLGGTQSVSADNAIESYSWQQVAGPVVQIANANHSLASFVIPTINDPTIIKVELQVADGNGELEWDTVEVHGFGSASEIGLLYFFGESGEEISIDREWFLSSASAAMIVDRNFYNGIHVGFPTWHVNFVAPGDTAIEEGSYQNAVSYPSIGSDFPELSLSGDGRSCNSSTGRFDVLDLTYDQNGDVLVAAIDFTQTCGGTGKVLNGYVRIGSEIPFPSADSR
jgi:hypothetical protein